MNSRQVMSEPPNVPIHECLPSVHGRLDALLHQLALSSRRRTTAGVLRRFNLAVLERRVFIGFLAAARAANDHAAAAPPRTVTNSCRFTDDRRSDRSPTGVA